MTEEWAITWNGLAGRFEPFERPKHPPFGSALPKTEFYASKAEAWDAWAARLLRWAEQHERQAAGLRRKVREVLGE